MTDGPVSRYAVNVDLAWIPDPRLPDRRGRLLLRRTVHPRWPAAGEPAGPVTEFWISEPVSEDVLLTAAPTTEPRTWERIVRGQPVAAVASPVALRPPTDGDRADLRKLLGRTATTEPVPERTTRPLLDLDATVRAAGGRLTVERARVGRAAADVLTHPLRSVFEAPLRGLARVAGHPGTPAPAGGHERSSRRSHWYREAELSRTVFADLELREAAGEPPDDVPVRRVAAPDVATGLAAPPGDGGPHVRVGGPFGQFLRTLVVVVTGDAVHLATPTPAGAALLRGHPGVASALATCLAPAGDDPDVVTLHADLRAVVDDLPPEWKPGTDLDLRPGPTFTSVGVPR